MKIRIIVKPSKLKDSNLWHWDVEEKIGDKWVMGYTYHDDTHFFFGGTAESREDAIEFARNRARIYIIERSRYKHAFHKKVLKKLTYTEEIKVDE